MNVYLSSTLDDLGDERRAARDALVASGCAVQESYTADEKSLRESCLDDVEKCDAYLLILGLRYGFVPQFDHNTKSITQLEYERAKAKGLRRLVFIKNASAVLANRTDAYTGEHPKELIEAFRNRFATGGDDEPRGAVFTSADELKFGISQALARLRQQVSGATPFLSGQVQHPWQIVNDAAICTLPGTDDDLQLSAVASVDRRIDVFTLSPQADHEYLGELDRRARRSRCLLIVLRPQSLSRLRIQLPVVVSALTALRSRTRVFGLLVDVTGASLPPELAAAFDDLFESQLADWSAANQQATFERLGRWRRERVPDAIDAAQIGIPYLVVALTRTEAEAMRAQPELLFGRFGQATPLRRKAFDELNKSLSAAGVTWPAGFYGDRRDDWRPFGPAAPAAEQFVLEAARKVNAAPQGSRERRVLVRSQLLPQRYRLEEFLQDAYGSSDNLKRVCDEGCLVIVDEFALLHPDLRPQIDLLLSSNNAAVVSISACDPAFESLGSLLDEFSYLRVGNLFMRFRETEDARCELALNSVARFQRWLRFVLPELMITLGQRQSDPALVDKADALFAS